MNKNLFLTVQKFEAALEAEKKLGEEAEYILECIGIYGPKLNACDSIHLKRLERVIQELNRSVYIFGCNCWRLTLSQGRRRSQDFYE